MSKPPRRGQVTQRRLIRKKPKAKHGDGGSIRSLRPTGGLKPIVVNRHDGMTCNIR